MVWVVAGLLAISARADPQRDKNTLYYAAGLGTDKLDPMLKSHGWCEVSSLIFNRLYRVSAEGQMEYDLLESATWSPDGKTLTLDLKKYVFWHDGKPLTSTDVVYTFDVLFDPATPTDLDKDLAGITSWKLVDPRRVIVNFKAPDPHIDGRLSEVPILPAHLLKGNNIATSSFNTHPIGTGAYAFDRRESPDIVWLVANERYHEGPPAIKRIKVVSIPDDRARSAALLTSLDYDVGLVKLNAADSTADWVQGVTTYASGAWRGMPINLRSRTFQDARVRRAIARTVDRDQLVSKAAPFGSAAPAYVPMVPGTWAYPTNLQIDTTPDPTAGRRLLDEAGWILGPDGIRTKNGKRLVLRLIVWRDEAFRRRASEALKWQLRAVGIDVEMHLFDNAGYNEHASDMGDQYDSFIGGWGGLSDPIGNIYRKFHSNGSQNHMGYRDRQVDRLIEQAMATANRDNARRILSQAIKKVIDASVFIPLAYPKYTFVISERLDPESMPAGPIDSWYEITKHAYAWRFME